MNPHTAPSSALGSALRSAPGPASAAPLRPLCLRPHSARSGACLLAGVLAGLCLAGIQPASAAPSPEAVPAKAGAGQAQAAGKSNDAKPGCAASQDAADKNSASRHIAPPQAEAGWPAPGGKPGETHGGTLGGTPGETSRETPGEAASGKQPGSQGQAPAGQDQRRQPLPEDAERALRDQLLEESIERLLPLEPGEIRTYLERRDSVEGAIQPGPARMRTETRKISAVPGAAPQVIRLTAGYSSTLIFQDASGAPWPVDAVILGDRKAFQASQPGAHAGPREGQGSRAARGGEGGEQAPGESYAGDAGHANLVTLVPLTNHASSNLVVTLEGAPYPVILHLLTESSAKQARVEDALVVFRLDTPGPRAPLPAVGPAQPGPVTRELLNLVHGIPPEGAARLRLEPELWGTDLWEHGGRRYLRTGHQPVWPAWSAQAGQAVKVYVMPKTPGIVLSVNGRRVSLTVEGRRERQGGER